MNLIFKPSRAKLAAMQSANLEDNNELTTDEHTLGLLLLNHPSSQYFFQNADCMDLIYTDNGTLVGFIQYKDIDDITHLLALYILDEHRGQGYGTVATTWLLHHVVKTKQVVADLNMSEPAILRIAEKVGAVPNDDNKEGSYKGYRYAPVFPM